MLEAGDQSIEFVVYRVYFSTAASLINELIEAKNEHRFGKRIKQFSRFDLLICDELGYIPFDRHGTDLLFCARFFRPPEGQLVAQRYEIGESWGNWDELGLMQQLGTLPQMGGIQKAPAVETVTLTVTGMA